MPIDPVGKSSRRRGKPWASNRASRSKTSGPSTAGLATAQEHRGAGRIEIGAIPIGGVTFMKSSDSAKPQFRNYTIGGTLIGNLTQWVGLEADVGVAVGRKQDLTFNG